ncbi:indole-3-glycerol phosphate synthase [Corynebacterium otitidis]
MAVTVVPGIPAAQRAALERRQGTVPLADIKARALRAPAPADAHRALVGEGCAILAQPGPAASPAELAGTCDLAISPLSGGLPALTRLSGSGLPVVATGLVFSPYQVYELRAAGADAVPLPADLLADDHAAGLIDLVESLGMLAVPVVGDAAGAGRVVELGARAIAAATPAPLSEISAGLPASVAVLAGQTALAPADVLRAASRGADGIAAPRGAATGALRALSAAGHHPACAGRRRPGAHS